MNQLTLERNRVTLLPNNIHFLAVLEAPVMPDLTKSKTPAIDSHTENTPSVHTNHR